MGGTASRPLDTHEPFWYNAPMPTKFDIFSVLDYMKKNECDSEYAFRAFIVTELTLPSGQVVDLKSLFPPSQLRTVENKSDFNRLLNAELDSLREHKKILRVEVFQNGIPIYDFVP